MGKKTQEDGSYGGRANLAIPPSRSRIIRYVVLTLIGIAVVLVVLEQTGPPSPEPPAPDLTHVDPAVAEKIAEVTAQVRHAPDSGPVWALPSRGRRFVRVLSLVHAGHSTRQICTERLLAAVRR